MARFPDSRIIAERQRLPMLNRAQWRASSSGVGRVANASEDAKVPLRSSLTVAGPCGFRTHFP